MIFNTKLVLLSLVALVAAQNSSNPPTADPCILACVTSAALAANCAGPTDINCVCTSIKFQSAANTCLQANCTAPDEQTAVSLQEAECALDFTGVSSSSAAASSPSATSPANSNAQGFGPGPAPASTSLSSASTLVDSNMWGLAAGVFGAVTAVTL